MKNIHYTYILYIYVMYPFLKLLAAVGGTMSWAAAAGCGALNLDLDGGRRTLGPGVN